ncbi:MAG TPA: iron transporter, partial [Motiliproteus sp.]
DGGHGGHGGHGDHGAADIHLEASVTALANNAWGFKEGHWVPYLNIHYSVFKNGSFFRASGRLIPMASNGGPHYGANIQLDGPGKYFVTYRVEPPKATEFPYHTDKETGVNGWWPSFEMKDSFTYLGVGKKGGY